MQSESKRVPDQLCFTVKGKHPGSCHYALLLGTNEARGERQYLSDVEIAAEPYQGLTKLAEDGNTLLQVREEMFSVAVLSIRFVIKHWDGFI